MKSALTDEELIRVYFRNQPSYCFGILYKRYYQTIYKQCLRLTRHAEQAQDFSQDIFVKVFHKLGTFAQRSRFTTARRPGWLYSIAHNYCRDQIRLGERLPTIAINQYLEMTLIDKTELLPQPEVVSQFSLAIDSLSYAEQTLIRLKYEQELSLRELANLSGVSLSAVKMRLKRSREKVERCYAQQLAR